MDVRLVVGGALTRNAVLCELLWKYAERLEQEGSGGEPAPCFIVPEWSPEQPPSASSGSRVLTVHVHALRAAPHRADVLDAVLRVVHAVLTDDGVSPLITARRVSTPTSLVVSDLGTVVRSGSWTIAPVRSCGAAAAHRLLPWPDCRTSDVAVGAPPRTSVSLN